MVKIGRWSLLFINRIRISFPIFIKENKFFVPIVLGILSTKQDFRCLVLSFL